MVTKTTLSLPSSNYFQFLNTYGNSVNVKCKAAGFTGNNYFTASLRFVINTSLNKITNVHFDKITHEGKNNVPVIDCENNYCYYYEIDSHSFSSSCSSSIINDTYEQEIYVSIKYMLETAIVTSVNVTPATPQITVTLTLPQTITQLVLKLAIGVKGSQGSKCSSKSKCSKKSCLSSEICINKNKITKILKLIAWFTVVSFIIHFLKNKICNIKFHWIDPNFHGCTDCFEIPLHTKSDLSLSDTQSLTHPLSINDVALQAAASPTSPSFIPTPTPIIDPLTKLHKKCLSYIIKLKNILI